MDEQPRSPSSAPEGSGAAGEEAAKRSAAEADKRRRRIQRMEYEQEERTAKRPSNAVPKLEEES